MIDVVIVDVPPSYGMLLSRHKVTYVVGNIQYYLSHATILSFGGESRHLYREPKMTYVISDTEKPTNFNSYNTNNVRNFMLFLEPPTSNYYVPFMCEGENFDPFEL
jgi:hypothetical protein